MKPLKCPECGSLAVKVEFTGLLIQDEEGNETVDDVSRDVSGDGYAECVACGHDGIAEDFGAR